MMKLFLLLFVVSISAFAADGDIGTGCIYTSNRASCMITNNTDVKKTCDVRVQITTSKFQKTTKKKAVIEPHLAEFIEALPAWDDKIEKAQVAAICK